MNNKEIMGKEMYEALGNKKHKFDEKSFIEGFIYGLMQTEEIMKARGKGK